MYILDVKDVTRVEVIDNKGRAYVNTHCEDVEVSLQDEGRTLKIFLKNTTPPQPTKEQVEKFLNMTKKDFVNI